MRVCEGKREPGERANEQGQEIIKIAAECLRERKTKESLFVFHSAANTGRRCGGQEKPFRSRPREAAHFFETCPLLFVIEDEMRRMRRNFDLRDENDLLRAKEEVGWLCLHLLVTRDFTVRMMTISAGG